MTSGVLLPWILDEAEEDKRMSVYGEREEGVRKYEARYKAYSRNLFECDIVPTPVIDRDSIPRPVEAGAIGSSANTSIGSIDAGVIRPLGRCSGNGSRRRGVR